MIAANSASRAISAFERARRLDAEDGPDFPGAEPGDQLGEPFPGNAPLAGDPQVGVDHLDVAARPPISAALSARAAVLLAGLETLFNESFLVRYSPSNNSIMAPAWMYPANRKISAWSVRR